MAHSSTDIINARADALSAIDRNRKILEGVIAAGENYKRALSMLSVATPAPGPKHLDFPGNGVSLKEAAA
jgi:hypothetical protein